MPIAGLLGKLGLGIIGELLGSILGGSPDKPDLPAGLNWTTSVFLTKQPVTTGWRPLFGSWKAETAWIEPFPAFHGDCVQDSQTGLVVGVYDKKMQEVYEFQGYTLEGIPIGSRFPELAQYNGKRTPDIRFPKGAYFGREVPVTIGLRQHTTFPEKDYEAGQSAPVWEVLHKFLSSPFSSQAAGDFLAEMMESASINARVVYGKAPATPGAAVSPPSPLTAAFGGLDTTTIIIIAALLLLLLVVMK